MLIIPLYIYLLFSRRIKTREVIAVLLVASEGTLMAIMGKSIIVNTGVGTFTIKGYLCKLQIV